MLALWYGARSVLFVLFLALSVVPWALAVVWPRPAATSAAASRRR